MYRLIPYGLLAGITLVTIGGFITLTATSFSTIVNFALINRNLAALLITIGWLVFIWSYIIGLSSKHAINETTDVDNKQAMESGYDKRKAIRSIVETFQNKLSWLVFPLVALILYLIFKTDIPWNMIEAGILIIIIITLFFIVMKYEDPSDSNEIDRFPEYKGISSYLRMTDYRNHPISLSLILFTVIVLYYVWLNPFGVMDDYDMIDHSSRYAISLPQVTRILILTIFFNTFIYISHNYNFLGLRKIYVSNDMVFKLQTFEFISCGVILFLWIFSIIKFYLSF